MSEFNNDNLISNLKSILGTNPQCINILEDKISVDIQMEYLQLFRKFKTENLTISIEDVKNKILNDNLDSDSLRELLVRLVITEEVPALRFLESLIEIKDFQEIEMAKLAFLQCKMLIQGSLLNENQIMISTGLGGKGNKLRYFIVFFGQNNIDFTESQINILEKEVNFNFERNNCVKEDINVIENLFTLLALIPIDVSVGDVLKPIFEEANCLGVNLAKNFIVSNVKQLSIEEIKKFASNQELNNTNSKNIDS